MKKAYSFRLSESAIGMVRAFARDWDKSEGGVVEYWAGYFARMPQEKTAEMAKEILGDDVEEEVEKPKVEEAKVTITMDYKEYMEKLPKGWRVSDGVGSKTVYDNYDMCRRIFKEGRDY